MAHNLSTTNGRTAFAYYGEEPWHGLGQKLAAPATAEEAIRAAGLDYIVELAPLVTMDGLDVPQRKAVVRYDTQEVLGVVGCNYQPIQNTQAFGLMDAIVADGGLRYHTAGALGRGERVFLFAKLPGHICVKDSDDLVDRYLLLSNSHDGSAALRIYFTPIRVVCSNTLAMAERRSRGQGVSIMHKGDLAAKIKQAQQTLGLAHRYFDDAAAKINRLASYYPSQAELRAYFKALYPDPDEGKDSTRTEKVREELQRLFEEGRGHDDPAIKGTAWAPFNAVTEYIDHRRPTRGTHERERASNRLSSIWFGSRARLKERAWELALEMAGAN
jgi:phage/plasmid-like protein (TIGR03299 family)